MTVFDAADERRFGPLSCNACDTRTGAHRPDCPDFESERYPPAAREKYVLAAGPDRPSRPKGEA